MKISLAPWGLGPDCSIEQIYRTAWDVDGRYILKKSGGEQARRNLTISRLLREHGIPAMKVAPTRSGQETVTCGEDCYLLMERIAGCHLTDIFHGDYESVGFDCGTIIGKLHRALLQCQQVLETRENSLYGEMTGWIEAYLERSGYPYLSRAEFSALCGQLGQYGELPRQLIHRDLHVGNLLFENGELTGYIDFDLSEINIRVFDLCYFCLGQLMEAAGDPETEDRWIGFARQVFAGYMVENGLSPQELEAALCVMKCIEVLFIAYFGVQNQPESARQAAELYGLLCRREGEIAGAISAVGAKRPLEEI